MEVCRYGQGPHNSPSKGWRQQTSERVKNTLLAVETREGGGDMQIDQPNYPSHDARRHVEYELLGALTVMLG